MQRRTFLGYVSLILPAMAVPLTTLGAVAGPLRQILTRSYPSVSDLQAGLHAVPGAQLPKQVYSGGRIWNAYYLGARHVGGGVYEVKVRLI